MDIVFFGSGPVAAESLRLLAKNFSIEAVITKPKPKHHKGSVPVIEAAEQLDLVVHTAENKNTLSMLIESLKLKSEVAVLIDFGIIVSQDVIDYFPLGIVNSHFSLLPKLRGADPITFSILNGDEYTGVSLMLIDAGMDTGKLIAQERLKIKPTHNNQNLTNDLISLSDELLTKKLPEYVNGSIQPQNQPKDEDATYSRKLSKSDGIIDWTMSAEQIEREIRAFKGWPKSRTVINEKDIVIHEAEVASENIPTGTWKVIDGKILVGCGAGSLEIKNLQPAGKKPMDASSFLAGYKHLFED